MPARFGDTGDGISTIGLVTGCQWLTKLIADGKQIGVAQDLTPAVLRTCARILTHEIL
jgi:hypothetical protein